MPGPLRPTQARQPGRPLDRRTIWPFPPTPFGRPPAPRGGVRLHRRQPRQRLPRRPQAEPRRARRSAFCPKGRLPKKPTARWKQAGWPKDRAYPEKRSAGLRSTRTCPEKSSPGSAGASPRQRSTPQPTYGRVHPRCRRAIQPTHHGVSRHRAMPKGLLEPGTRRPRASRVRLRASGVVNGFLPRAGDSKERHNRSQGLTKKMRYAVNMRENDYLLHRLSRFFWLLPPP